MKILLEVFVFVGILSLISCELVPNFPGEQPIFFDGSSAEPSPVETGESRDILVIDSFTFDTSPPIITVIDGALPISNSAFDSDSSILGGERDILLVVEEGTTGIVFAAGVSGDSFTISTPNEGNGIVLLQYDGIDGSVDLDSENGLGGLDIAQGDAIGFRIVASTDIPTEFTLSVYDNQGRSVSTRNQVNGGLEVQSYELLFEDFSGQLDFSSVNAIEFEIEAFDNVDFNLLNFVTFTNIVVPPVVSGCLQGSVAPCLTNYYRLEELDNIQIGEYITVHYSAAGEPAFPNSTANFYLLSSKFEDLQDELRRNTNIVSTLGGLPGATQYDYLCEDDCEIEVVWSILDDDDATYYIGVEGFGVGFVDYEICLTRGRVPIVPLTDNVGVVIRRDERATTPPDDHVRYYSYYSIDVPTELFSEGTYLVVNVSRAAPIGDYTLRLMHEGLPESPLDTGILGSVDYNSRGGRSDDSIYPFCVDRSSTNTGGDFFAHPINEQDIMSCECTTQPQVLGDGFQQTCQLTVDPCNFKYGTWYISLELPARAQPGNPGDDTGQIDYTIEAEVVQRVVTTLPRGLAIPGEVYPDATRHYRINVPERDVGAMDTHFVVTISNVKGGFVHAFVHQEIGNDRLAGGPEGCSASTADCRTCDSCNAIVEKCNFASGPWYISVGVGYDAENGEFEFFDADRLPVGYTITVDWIKETAPVAITSGVPVTGSVGEALYDFYVLDVPPTIDTVLYVELFVKANNTEVALAILHDDLPGGECYARPDYFCLTGDPRGIRSSYGPTSFIDNEAIQRESCNYMIQACELTAGPLYISVYGHRTGYTPYGDSTFYQIPVEYTLYAEFDTPLALSSGVSYSEVVHEHHYQHYYLRVDQATIGQWVSVEVTNIKHGIPQSIEAYVNYNFIAGDCPCYDHLYSCTQNATCSEDALYTPFAHADIESVDNCCTILVHPSDFRNGIWYVSVRGVNEDQFQYTTPIGYTLTVTLHDAPVFNFLPLGQFFHGTAPRWNMTHEYTHFRLAAEAIPNHDLVLKLTWVQNCEVRHRGQHDNTGESLSLYVNHEAVAGKNPTGHVYSCTAGAVDQSYCTVVIPSCEWLSGGYLLAVRGDYDADFDARFTLHASVEDNRSVRLRDGAPHYDRVNEGVYKHFFIETDAEEDQLLTIDVYSNQDQDPITVYINKDTRGGSLPCYESMFECHTSSCCSWQFKACDITPGRYYISVKGSPSHWYHVSTEFTIVASHQPVHTVLYDNFPVTGHLPTAGQVAHYSYNVDQLVPGHTLEFTVDNVKHGSVEVYGQFESLAGRCPCYTWEKHCSATSADKDWCTIRLAPCELEVGTYFFSVVANEQLSPDPPIFMTPIGFTVEASVTIPSYGSIESDLGRQVEDTLSEQLAGGHYRHYDISWDDDDFNSGYHLIVEITNVRNGNLEVFYNPLVPGDQTCHEAQLCSEGISGGADCFWQLPYCLTRPLDDPLNHYISVYNADTGNRVAADYDILIWKQPIPSVDPNFLFSLDDRSIIFDDDDSQLAVNHSPLLEPNGWTQFIRLPNIVLDSVDEDGNGEMLELFFYSITNNVGAPMSFNVYAHPNEPAGAHECCSGDLASCQGAPCSHTADTTTEVNGREIISHTCDLPNGVGNTNPAIPYFGERCVVRVWPCEFNKYCNNDEPTDWFISVVPVAPTDQFSIGPGLEYSFQWRVRNIRTSDAYLRQAGTIDLTEFIEFDTYTPVFSVVSESTEMQGWRSFYVGFSEPEARISIQTRFVQGSGVVYIEGDSFASATPTCNEYECSNDSAAVDCNSNGRFLTSECCSNIPQSGYFITVRNTGEPESDLFVDFRITKVIIPGVFEIPAHPTRQDPFVAASSVRYEGYDFYQLTIDDDDLDEYKTWDISIFRIGNSPDPLNAYIRFGERAGNYGPATNQALYGDTDEGCFAWQYECTMETLSDSCFFQIPACALVEGHWYISIHNPTADLVENTFAVRPQYELVTFISDSPTVLTLNEPFIVSAGPVSVEPLVHFSIRFNAQDGGFDDREDLESYFTRFLRFQIDNINEGVLDMWVNYDALAGPEVEGSCTGNIGHRVCEPEFGCYFDVLPCDNGDDMFKLKTGVYYIAVRLSTPTPYRLSVFDIAEPYTLIPIDRVEEGIVQRTNTENIFYTHTATAQELSDNGDGEGNYRYVIDFENPETNDDDMDDNQYLLFRIDAPQGITGEQTAEFHVWRDDCTRFECDLLGPASSCTIDALTLGPCALKGGRYYMNVVNPTAIPFTISAFLNETILVPIQDRQEITEFLFPYEYQEYFYDSHDVGEGAMLTVNVCSVCGDVEAWIRPDAPAGPTPDVTGEATSCSMDHCSTDGPVNDAFGDFDNANCCQLFLDTCNYDDSRRYYIGIRGVSTLFPNEGNTILALPILYKIDVEQTTVNFTDISYGGCPAVVTSGLDDATKNVPQQFTFDLETVNVGSSLRVALQLPEEFATQDLNGTVAVHFNHSHGYSNDCEDDVSTSMFCSTLTYCEFVIPYCQLAKQDASRIYILADAPRGSVVEVDRWDPIVPVIKENIHYHSTISGPAHFEHPYQPNRQIYRFSLRPDDKEFYARVHVHSVRDGAVSVMVNSGQNPWSMDAGCVKPLFVDNSSCVGVTDSCFIEIKWSDVQQAEGSFLSNPSTFWLTVTGDEQSCQQANIHYSTVVESNFVITYYPVGETVCGEVHEGDYNFHRISDSARRPQETYLRFTIQDLNDDESVSLAVRNGRLATVDEEVIVLSSSDFEDGALVYNHYCSQDELYFSVHGDQASSSEPIQYRLSVERADARIKELFDDSVYYHDDDDDDACGGNLDFYIFPLTIRDASPEGSFFRVAVDSESYTEVNVNRGSLGGPLCYNAAGGSNDPRETGTTTVNLYDFCDFEDDAYYVTVYAEGPYYIYTDIRDDPEELSIGEIFRDELEPGMYQMYTLEICDDWFEADDRLVIEITDVEHGDVYGWINHDSNPGFYNRVQHGVSQTGDCNMDNALADFGASASGYDYLLIDSCELKAGTYHILIRAAPHEDSPERNCQHVEYRLFPYLIDYQIEPRVIFPNSVIFDTVDYYTINRIQDNSVQFINYYSLTPLQDDEGFTEQISHAVIRLANVQGGLLRLRVMCGHLAVAEFGYLDGEIYGLTSTGAINEEWRMQSGSNPLTYQRMLDPRSSIYQEECDGCTDFCCEMSFDDIEEYQKDSSCAIWIPSCYLVWADLYIAVEPVQQFSEDHSISYDLSVTQSVDYTRLEANSALTGTFSEDNWDYDFFYSVTDEPESMRWRVVVTSGEGVLVTVRNHRCPLQASWSKQIWCDAKYFDRPWMCDIEIPTLAAHPGGINAFFLSVYGKNATYSLSHFAGRENCHLVTGSGRSDGLDFCAGLVPYATWRWENYVNLDNEARCLFEELYKEFQVQPCFKGVTPECNATLEAFACYESFHACDEFGFVVPTCRQACDSVEQECFNSFDHVNLEYYQCASPHYGDGYSATCTMPENLLEAQKAFQDEISDEHFN